MPIKREILKEKKNRLLKQINYQLFNILLKTYANMFAYSFNPFPPRPAKTTPFVSLLCLRPDNLILFKAEHLGEKALSRPTVSARGATIHRTIDAS